MLKSEIAAATDELEGAKRLAILDYEGDVALQCAKVEGHLEAAAWPCKESESLSWQQFLERSDSWLNYKWGDAMRADLKARVRLKDQVLPAMERAPTSLAIRDRQSVILLLPNA